MQINRFCMFIDRYGVDNHWLRIDYLRPRGKIPDVDLSIKARFANTDRNTDVSSLGLCKSQ